MYIAAEDIRNYNGDCLGGTAYQSLDDFYNFCLIPPMLTGEEDNLLFYTPFLEKCLSKFGENLDTLESFLTERGFTVTRGHNSFKISWLEV